jgi:hypothetical protein
VLYELLAMLALHRLLQREADVRVAARFLLVFGGARCALQGLREETALGPPLVAPEWLAGVWLALGVLGCTVSSMASPRNGPDTRPLSVAAVAAASVPRKEPRCVPLRR